MMQKDLDVFQKARYLFLKPRYLFQKARHLFHIGADGIIPSLSRSFLLSVHPYILAKTHYQSID